MRFLGYRTAWFGFRKDFAGTKFHQKKNKTTQDQLKFVKFFVHLFLINVKTSWVRQRLATGYYICCINQDLFKTSNNSFYATAYSRCSCFHLSEITKNNQGGLAALISIFLYFYVFFLYNKKGKLRAIRKCFLMIRHCHSSSVAQNIQAKLLPKRMLTILVSK